MDGLAEDESCRFRPPKSVQEEDSLLVQSKPKSKILFQFTTINVTVNVLRKSLLKMKPQKM